MFDARKRDWNYMEQLSELDEISSRAMMGEYILYYRGRVFEPEGRCPIFSAIYSSCPASYSSWMSFGSLSGSMAVMLSSFPSAIAVS